MAGQERYIDADALIEKLRAMAVPYPCISTPSYGSGSASLDSALNSILSGSVGGAVHSALVQFQMQLIKAIEETATLKGTPCFLCKQRDCDELPAKVHI
jgi:uncharacterized membrane protein